MATGFPLGLGLWRPICQSEHLPVFHVCVFANSLHSLCHKGSFLGQVDELCSENNVLIACEVVTKYINSQNKFKYWPNIKW